MTLHRFADLIAGFASPPVWAAFWVTLFWSVLRHSATRWTAYWARSWSWGAGCVIVCALVQSAFAAAIGGAVSLAVALIIRWWRKNGRRVQALIGAKSRAVRDAMVARMPKSRTVPQGA